jgi:hypothetical protein
MHETGAHPFTPGALTGLSVWLEGVSQGPEATRMAAPFILISRFKVKEGSPDDLRDYARKVTELVEAKEPRVIALHAFLSEDGTELSTFHLHPDVASTEFHMQVQQDHWGEIIRPVASMLEGISVDFYGAMPPESAVANFRRAGNEISIKPVHLAGFTRARSA